jgi:hypothetical protein
VAFTIFGVASAVGGVLALFLPETLGSTLPDTFQDVEVPNSQFLLYTFKFCSLKGPKREIFVAGIFVQIRPILIGNLGTRPKNPKKLCLGP